MLRLSTDPQGSMATWMLMERLARKPTSTQQSMLVQSGRIRQEVVPDREAGVEAVSQSEVIKMKSHSFTQNL